MKYLTLFIDATDLEQVRLALSTGSEHYFVNENLSESLVSEIKKFLGKQKIKLIELKKIGVVAGPGHFSKVRTAVAVANALAFGLQIPVVGIKAGQKVDWPKLLGQKGSEMVKPFYDKMPNITLSKKIV